MMHFALSLLGVGFSDHAKLVYFNPRGPSESHVMVIGPHFRSVG